MAVRPEATDTTTVYAPGELGETVMPHVRDYGMKRARSFGSYACGEATGERRCADGAVWV